MAQEESSLFPAMERIRLNCEQFICDAFDALCDHEGRERVQTALPMELFKKLESESLQRQKLLRTLKRHGRVLERASIDMSHVVSSKVGSASLFKKKIPTKAKTLSLHMIKS
eukprot:jgi/Botrbrau1/21194/Bobra.0580s0001.1